MSWLPVTPIDRMPKRHEYALRMRVPAAGGKEIRRIIITLRTAEFSGDFASPGQRVSVALGFGEHAGMVRIERGPGLHTLWKISDKLACIKIPVFDCIDTDAHESAIEDYQSGENWIEFRLPAWATPAPTWNEPTHPDVKPSAYETGAMLNKPVKRDPWADPEHKPATAAQKVQRGFAMAAMALPDPMIGAKEANVRQQPK